MNYKVLTFIFLTSLIAVAFGVFFGSIVDRFGKTCCGYQKAKTCLILSSVIEYQNAPQNQTHNDTSSGENDYGDERLVFLVQMNLTQADINQAIDEESKRTSGISSQNILKRQETTADENQSFLINVTAYENDDEAWTSDDDDIHNLEDDFPVGDVVTCFYKPEYLVPVFCNAKKESGENQNSNVEKQDSEENICGYEYAEDESVYLKADDELVGLILLVPIYLLFFGLLGVAGLLAVFFQEKKMFGYK